MVGGDPARHRAEKLLCNGKQGKVGQGKARLGKARETHAAAHMRFRYSQLRIPTGHIEI